MGAHVLLVDDEPDIRLLARIALQAEGYDVTEAATGEEALELVETEDPDLVILDIRLLARIALQAEGHDVTEAATGEEALELVDSVDPDLVILDIRLPGLDGWEVLERVRTDMDPDTMPIVMMSAHSSDSTLERARRAGSNDYIVKPFTVDDLIRVVNEQARGAA